MFIHDNRIRAGRPVAVDPATVAKMIDQAMQQCTESQAHQSCADVPPRHCPDNGELWIRRRDEGSGS